MDNQKQQQMESNCSCGSGKKAGECCMKGEECYCGSGKPAVFCHYVEEE